MKRHATSWGIACAALCALPLGPTAASANTAVALPGLAVRPTKLTVRADRLEASPAADCGVGRPCATRMTLRGRVFVGGKGLRIEAPSMSLQLGKDGGAVQIEAEGRVRCTLGARRGQADKLSYLVRRGLLELVGNARLVLPRLGATLQGQRIAVDLRQGRVTVQNARVEMGARAP